jgi:sodium-coupled neutral amino acid transporter 9
MGSTILVLPVLFFQNGIISALVVSFIIAIISAKTTSLLIVHNKDEEVLSKLKTNFILQLDLPDTLLRVLGMRWKKGFIYSTVLSLWLTGMIYQILVIN